jgi:membrane-bound lytic murein transglycosylase B
MNGFPAANHALPHGAARLLPTALLVLLLCSLPACAGKTPAPDIPQDGSLRPDLSARPEGSPPPETLRVQVREPESPKPEGLVGPVAATWFPLLERLKADGLGGEDLLRIFAGLGDTYSPKPMGAKVSELFTYKYLRPARRPVPGAGAGRVYPGFVTPENLALCRAFLDANERAFTLAEERYSVPREIIVALILVETKLGAYLGRENAFWSLACMAAADIPERIGEVLGALPDVDAKRLAWVRATLKERSAWAYRELKALIRHSREYGLDPLAMPGSVYGAIGLCQFMPSNLKPYGVDGDQDGTINVFDPADAIPSVGNYLRGHGWKPGLSREGRHAVIKRDNNSIVYANTILAVAEALAPPARVSALPDSRPDGAGLLQYFPRNWRN